MSHLSTEEFVDLLDDALPAARRSHLEGCARCRTEAEGLGAVMSRVSAAREVPDPSPLFWDHLSARVGEGLGAPPVRTWKERLWWPGSAWTTGLAAMLMVLLVSQQSFHAPVAVLVHQPVGPAPSHVVAGDDPDDDLDTDQAWALVRSVADGIAVDAAQDAGISARPDAAERMTQELSAREKSELAQLLAGELKRSSE